jgi:hypothetical protein
MSMLAAALRYVEMKIPVFPIHTPKQDGGCSCGKKSCSNTGKHPRTIHGLKDATINVVQIKEWWTTWPNGNIGIPTGLASGLLVLDVDARHDGIESLGQMQLHHEPLPDTARVITGGGGRHIFFKYPEASEIKNSTNLNGYSGLDIRGNGGYVVAAPSLHASGRRYHRDRSAPKKLALPPDWFIQLAANGSGRARSDNKLLDTENILKGVPEGQRNDSVFTLAFNLRRSGVPKEFAETLVLQAAANCTPPLPKSEAIKTLSGVYQRYQSRQATPSEWSEPLPIENALPAVDSFEIELLPDSLRRAALDISERMQAPLDFPAICLICTLAGAVNRRAVIQPKANDTTWTVVPNLWGGIIAPPGSMKSPTLSAAMEPLRLIDGEYRRQNEDLQMRRQNSLEEWEAQKAARKELLKAHYKSGKPHPSELPEAPQKPTRKRLVVNDCTFEALHEIMRENPAGTMLVRDELSGWWAQLDRQGREGERGFYLESWNGNTHYTIDRIGRGSVFVEACCLTILGGIQPAKLRSYLADTMRGGPTDDGLIQRFQLLVWPDSPPEWTLIDRPPDSEALAQVKTALEKLTALNADIPLKFRFSPDAQELVYEWLHVLEKNVRSEDIHPALAGHLSKFRKTMPALALLFELADRTTEEDFESNARVIQGNPSMHAVISLDHAKQAAAFCDYLESHARRVYSCVISPATHAAQVLATKIKMKKIGADGWFSLREVYLKGWSGLETPEASVRAVEILQDAGWIRPINEERGSQGGRPAMRFEINPKVRE